MSSSSSPFVFSDYIAEEFFDDNDKIEASGMAIAPDSSHLVIVGDESRILFINLLDADNTDSHCLVDKLDGKDMLEFGTDLEGVAIDPSAWDVSDINNRYVYVAHEGGKGEKFDEPYLYKLRYYYDPSAGDCSIRVVESTSLYNALPCLETDNGVESLALKSASSIVDDEPAVFLVGIQDTGNVYQVTSTGKAASSTCYNGIISGTTELDEKESPDISASTYNTQTNHLWLRMEGDETIVILDTMQDCVIARYTLKSSDDEEGLAIDWINQKMYLITDGQGDGSTLAVFDFTAPTLDKCIDEVEDIRQRQLTRKNSCDKFTVCGGTPFPTPSPMVSSPVVDTTTANDAEEADTGIALFPSLGITNTTVEIEESSSSGISTKEEEEEVLTTLQFKPPLLLPESTIDAPNKQIEYKSKEPVMPPADDSSLTFSEQSLESNTTLALSTESYTILDESNEQTNGLGAGLGFTFVCVCSFVVLYALRKYGNYHHRKEKRQFRKERNEILKKDKNGMTLPPTPTFSNDYSSDGGSIEIDLGGSISISSRVGAGDGADDIYEYGNKVNVAESTNSADLIVYAAKVDTLLKKIEEAESKLAITEEKLSTDGDDNV